MPTSPLQDHTLTAVVVRRTLASPLLPETAVAISPAYVVVSPNQAGVIVTPINALYASGFDTTHVTWDTTVLTLDETGAEYL